MLRKVTFSLSITSSRPQSVNNPTGLLLLSCASSRLSVDAPAFSLGWVLPKDRPSILVLESPAAPSGPGSVQLPKNLVELTQVCVKAHRKFVFIHRSILQSSQRVSCSRSRKFFPYERNPGTPTSNFAEHTNKKLC